MIDFRQVASLFINNNEVTELWLGGSKVWEKRAEVFTIEARVANVTIGSSRYGSPSTRDLEYSVDDGTTWNTFTLGSTTVTLANAGDKMMLRGTNSTIANTWQNYWTITFSNDVDVYGNLNSLLGGSETTLTGSFYGLFKGQTHLIDASELILPWTTIDTDALGCAAFESMFDHCSYLVGGPELPATTISGYIYKGMFQYCSNLENSMSFDHLSGTLLEGSIDGMFYHASIATPTIDFSNITSIGNNALYDSFNGAFQVSGLADFSSITSIGREGLKFAFGSCAIDEIDFSSLTTVNQYQAMYETFWACPIIKADFSNLTTVNAQQAMTRLFNLNTSLTRIGGVDENAQDPDERVGCDFSSLTTIDGDRAMEEAFKENTNLVSVEFPSLVRAGGKLADVGQSSRWTMNAMFKNCTSLESASFPSLTTFGWAANDNMFEGCSSLTSVSFPNLTNGVALWYMFEGCSSIEEVDFPNLTALDDSTNTDAMKHAFYNCSSLKRVGLPKLSLVTSGANWDYAFYGCTALEEIDFSWATAVPSITWTSGQHPFTNTNNTFKIVVPDALYDQWIVASGWSEQGIVEHIVNVAQLGFHFTAEEANSTITMSAVGSAPSVSLEYSTNSLTWQDFIVGTTTVTLANVGDKVWFKAGSNGNTKFATDGNNFNNFVMTGSISASGSIMYLLDGDGSDSATMDNYCFYGLFQDCASLADVEIDGLSNIPQYGCQKMFYNCTNLTSISLPDTVQADYVGLANFAEGCTSLETLSMPKFSYAGDSTMNSMVRSCSALQVLDFSQATAVPYLHVQDCFFDTNSTYRVVVPDALFDVWRLSWLWFHDDIVGHIVKASAPTTIVPLPAPASPAQRINHVYTNFSTLDTGYYPNSTTSVTINMQGNANGQVIVGFMDNDQADWRIFNSNSNLYLDIGDQRLNYNSIFSTNSRMYLEGGNFYYRVCNGTRVMGGSGTALSSGWETNRTFKVGAGRGQLDIYNIAIFEEVNGVKTCVMNLVPAFDNNGTACLWDAVGDSFYYSDGTYIGVQ